MDIWAILNEPVTWFTLTIVGVWTLYKWSTSTFTTFSDQGIPGPKPYPFVGNMWRLWQKNLPEHDFELVKKYGRTFGCFDGPQPNLWTTDPDLIKAIFVKDFDKFVNRRHPAYKTKVLRKLLNVVHDQEWKDLRTSVSPTLTLGKIKRMSFLIKDCVDNLVSKLHTQAKDVGQINAKTVFSAFSVDVIARCAFGMKIDNLGEKDDPFMKNALLIFNSPANRSPSIILPFAYPNLLQLLGEQIVFSKPARFFVDVLSNVVEGRSATEAKFHDFIEIALESISEYTKEGSEKSNPLWCKDEVEEIVTALSFVFMFAGFDTTSTTLTSICFLLAKHPEIQEKFHAEVIAKMEHFDEVSHDMIQDMPYLDQIINEALRIYPPLQRMERRCNQDITINGIKFKKGMLITVPTFSLHRLEEFYPDPERFDPDRWEPEKKKNMNQYVYMPYGLGPRNCVGMRFAQEEMKMALCAMIKQFRFFPTDKTPEKMQFENGVMAIIQPINAFVGIELRNVSTE